MSPTVVTTPGSPQRYGNPLESDVDQQSPSDVLPPPLCRTVREIGELERLPEGWDSYGAKAVSEAARHRAVALLTMLASRMDGPLFPPVVGPSVDGGVTLRWEPRDLEVVVTLLPCGGEYYVAPRDGDRVTAEDEIGSLEAAAKRLAQYLTS